MVPLQKPRVTGHVGHGSKTVTHCHLCCRLEGATENASTEKESTGGWNMQVRKTQVRMCNGGKRKYSNLKSILNSLRFSSLAFSVDPLSVGDSSDTVHLYCTRPVLYTRTRTHAGLMRRRAWVQKSQARRCRESLRQTVYTHCTSVHQAAKLVAALLRVARVTAGLAESNGSLPPGL